ncbi:MAG: hypothetical protein WDN28_29645 [Chthoniobacter sp.]
MSKDFAELDFQETALGDLSLRRRRMRGLDDLEVYEVILGDAFLMSSLFHVVEVALADLGLAALEPGSWDVVVGGLGLGYTAVAALKHPAVHELIVVDALAPVIEWHQRGLVPLGPVLCGDPRCRFVLADFFVLAASAEGFDPASPGRRFHAILLDIDHSPDNLLHERHGAFYSLAGPARPRRAFAARGRLRHVVRRPARGLFSPRASDGLRHRRGACRPIRQSSARLRIREHGLRARL